MNPIPTRLFPSFLCLLTAAFLAALPARAMDLASLTRDEAVRKRPSTDAAKVKELAKGDKLRIVERQGNWYRIENPGESGWVPFFAVRIASLPAGVAAVPTLHAHTRSAVMGVRGLDDTDLREARPDEAELAKLEAFVPSEEALRKFANAGRHELVPAAAPSPSPEAIPPAELEEELKFGHDIAAMLLGAAPLVDEPAVQKYLNLAGTWLAHRSGRPALKWRFALIRSDSLNAFAVPAGYVFVTLGLYRKLGSEAELAGVLSHEISHVVARDHYKVLHLSKVMENGTQGANKLIGGGNRLLKAAFSHMASKGCEIFTKALDQNAEFLADRNGLELAADAGYEPFGLPRVLQLLMLSRPEDADAKMILTTHPSPEERLRRIEAVAGGRLSELGRNPDMRARFVKFGLGHLKMVRAAAGPSPVPAPVPAPIPAP